VRTLLSAPCPTAANRSMSPAVENAVDLELLIPVVGI
jgi:hypothetical protein